MVLSQVWQGMGRLMLSALFSESSGDIVLAWK